MRRSAVLAALVAGGLASSLIAPGVAAAAVPHGRSAVNFHSTDSHHVVAPATTRPGIAHLRNTGGSAIVVVEAMHPAQANVHQAAKAIGAPSSKLLLKDYRLVAVAIEHSGSYTKLTSGTYYLADVGRAKIKAAHIETMNVSGRRIDARLPKSRGLVVTSLNNVHIAGSVAHSGYFHIQNHSSGLASFLFVDVADKTTEKQLKNLVAHPSFAKLFSVASENGNPFGVTSAATVGPRSESWIHYHAKAGRYVVALLIIRGRGNAHLHSGQVKVLKLT